MVIENDNINAKPNKITASIMSTPTVEKELESTYASIRPEGPAPTTTTVVLASTGPLNAYPSSSAPGVIFSCRFAIDSG